MSTLNSAKPDPADKAETAATTDAITVCAAIMVAENRILIAKRHPHLEQGGLWEFPGGKLEAGETPEQCLARELHEELGVSVCVGGFFAESVFAYPEKVIRLLAYWVQCDETEFILQDHEQIRWVYAEELNDYEIAPADLPFVEQLMGQESTQG